jgi:hypothetical protein
MIKRFMGTLPFSLQEMYFIPRIEPMIRNQ